MNKREKLKRWKAAIQRRNWTAKHVARELGIVPQVVRNWTNGSQEIPEKRLIQLETAK